MPQVANFRRRASRTNVSLKDRFAVRLSLILLGAVITAGASSAHADAYPERAVKIVVPFPAGGPTDVAARVIAHSLASRLGQSVVVENVTGAAGRIGTKAVLEAKPDGHTLLLGGTNINAVSRAVYKNLEFDPLHSFAPVAAICVDSMAMALSPKVPANTVPEFVQYARDNPGKVRFGAPPGIYTHLAGEFFKVKTGTDMQFIPYKGAAPAITDLLGGHIEMVFNNKSTLLAHFLEHKLKALAVTSELRWPELPDTPTMKEVGIHGFPKEVWFGLLAPAGTPTGVIDKLNHAVNEALNSAEVRASLGKLGMAAKTGTAGDFAAALAEQATSWKAVVEATGITSD